MCTTFKSGFTFACFHELGNCPFIIHLFIILVILLEIIPDESLSNFGPIPSKPVARVDNYMKTKFSSISGNYKTTLSGIFSLICSRRSSKLLCSIGALRFAATFMK